MHTFFGRSEVAKETAERAAEVETKVDSGTGVFRTAPRPTSATTAKTYDVICD